ncbi:MAG: hypothetical protein E6767_01005 [Dysgonomonas sp.]|nr:hypothetical protein [Dysgonomonas sp.]
MLDNFDKKKSPFRVPENYFEDFSAQIMNKLPEKEEKKARIVPLWRKVLPWTGVAAVAFGIFFSVGVFNKTPEKPIELVGTTGIASTDEEDYYLFLQDEVINEQYKEMFSY